MKDLITKLAGGAVCALLAGSAAFAQAPAVDMAQAGALGRGISSAAAMAERGAATAEVEGLVTAAVQQVIITSAADPRVVLAALDQTLASCRPTMQAGWTCPTNASAYAALTALRGIVVAQLGSTAPAALGTRGFAAFGSIPTTSVGGASYLAP